LKAEWILEKDYLALKRSDGIMIIPSGIDIFKAEYRGIANIGDTEFEKPSLSLTNISFSKYPLALQIKVQASKNPAKGLLFLELWGKCGQVLTLIRNPLARMPDQLVHEKIWYAIETGALGEVKQTMTRLGILDEGMLTLQQFFQLMTNPIETVPISIEFDLHSIPSLTNIEKIPDSFMGKLYPYQYTGYRWLCTIYDERLGCILGDEMGLGKTIQVICLMTRNFERNKNPALVVAPATLLENWRREIAKFAPSLSVYVHIGSDRTGFPSDLKKFDVVVTSFSTLIRDSSLFNLVRWNLVVADEAQAIKNPEAERTKILKTLPRQAAIAVTGTPVQNALTDLWSIMDFAIPGLLGDKSSFEKHYQNSVEGASNLEPLVTPVILRRTLSQVSIDLPSRIDIPQPIEMRPNMAVDYEKIRVDTLEKYGMGAQLVSLQKLRMYCTHPFLIENQDSTLDAANASPKYERLLEILEEIFSNREQALIFTSFKGMIDLLLTDLPKRFIDIWINWIDGRVPLEERQPRVDEFNTCKGPAVLLLNPAAAGTGLNLTGANHVIHYNLEWNPAVEDQASARAYRIGQKKPVTVHRLYYINSVEEVINDRVDFKRELAETTVKGVKGEKDNYSDILRALKITPLKNY
jgi:SNF2 family DNA or RNA helicase